MRRGLGKGLASGVAGLRASYKGGTPFDPHKGTKVPLIFLSRLQGMEKY